MDKENQLVTQIVVPKPPPKLDETKNPDVEAIEPGSAGMVRDSAFYDDDDDDDEDGA